MSVDELILAANQLNETDLDQLLHQIVTLRASRKAAVIPEAEALLLQKINQAISPELATQYQSLREKREAETLTENEHEVLIQLSKIIENLGAQRLKALARLAQIRPMSLLDVMDSLGIPSVNYA
jgi:hypothetical protein